MICQFESLKLSLEECAGILKKYHVDLLTILRYRDQQKTLVETVLSIVSIQIALIDFTRSVGIEPDFLIGHSLGELVTAYADRCISKEQAILCAYGRANITMSCKLKRGMMAVVNLRWDDLKQICPQGVVAACHNSDMYNAISGEYNEMIKFLDSLSKKHIKYIIVESCGIAFHSSHLDSTREKAFENMKNIIIEPKKRSPKWISTCFIDELNSISRQASAEYFDHNMISPVLFQEAIEKLPEKTVIVEISPSGIFKNILSSKFQYLSFFKKNFDEDVSILMILGQLYNYGFKIQLNSMYDKVTYPVRKGTPSISSLMKWDHSVDWFVPNYEEYFSEDLSNKKLILDYNCASDQHWFEYIFDDKRILPINYFLIEIWKFACFNFKEDFHKAIFIIENIKFFQDIELNLDRKTVLNIKILRHTGHFEITNDSKILIVSGQISIKQFYDSKMGNSEIKFEKYLQKRDFILSGEDMLKELRLRGLKMSQFQSEVYYTYDKLHASFEFNRNLAELLKITTLPLLIDTELKLVNKISSIRNIFLDMKLFRKNVLVTYSKDENMISSGGIILKGFELTPRSNNCEKLPLIEKYQHKPYESVFCEKTLKRKILRELQKLTITDKDFFDYIFKQINFSIKINRNINRKIMNHTINFYHQNIQNKKANFLILNEQNNKFKIEQIRKNCKMLMLNFDIFCKKIDELDNMDCALYDLIFFDILPDNTEDFFYQLYTFNTLLELLVSEKQFQGLFNLTIRKSATKFEENFKRNGIFNFEILNDLIGKNNFEIVNEITWNNIVSSLILKKKCEHLDSPRKMVKISTLKFDWIEKLKFLSFKNIDIKTRDIWLISNSEYDSGLLGLTHTLNLESSNMNYNCISYNSNEISDLKFLKRFSPFEKQLKMNFLYSGRNGLFHYDKFKSRITSRYRKSIEFSDNKMILMVGGLGGFAIELINWLIDKGCRTFGLTSRNGFINRYNRYKIEKYRKVYQSRIIIIKKSCVNNKNFKSIMNINKSIMILGSFFNLAMEISDCSFINESESNFQKACIPKLFTTKYFDREDRKSTNKLQNFVVFSSWCAGTGKIGQSSYSFANSSIEKICEDRRRNGLPGLAIQWGAIADVGILTKVKTKNFDLQSYEPMVMKDCLSSLEKIMKLENQTFKIYLKLTTNVVEKCDKSENPLLKKLSQKLDIDFDNDNYNQITLGQLAIDSLQIIEIQNILKQVKSGLLDADMKNLTIEQIIKEIKQSSF